MSFTHYCHPLSFLFRQAYISSFSLYPDGGDGTANYRNGELTLILMASSADPAVFKELLRGKKYLSQVPHTDAV